MIEIPLEKIPTESLYNIVKEFVLREGTDYGHEEQDLELKIAQVKSQLKNKSAIITFDPESETINIIPTI